MSTIKKTPSILDLVFWTLTRLILWLFLGSIGSVIVAVTIVIVKGESVGLEQLQMIAQADYMYVMTHANHRLMSIMNTALQQLPNSSSLPFMNATFIGVELAIIRLCLLTEWSPLLLLIGLIGLVDGLTQRYIRRQQVGRESTLIYHQAKALMMGSLIIGSFATLIMPITLLNTEWIGAIALFLFGLSIQITAKQFKKYL